MNKKLKIVLGSILLVILVGIGVCQIVIPTQTEQAFNIVWEWLNQPLPIVGVSLVVVGTFIVKVISMTTVGQARIKELQELYAEKQAEADKIVEEIKNNDEDLQKQVEYLQAEIVKLCETIKNVKVQEIGKEIVNHGETKDS